MYPTISWTKRMTGFQRYRLLPIYLLFFLVQLLPSTTALSRNGVTIKSTNQFIELVDMFAFEKRGGVILWVSDITFSSNSHPIITPNIHDLSQMGFYLSPRGTKGAELLKQYDNDKSLCYLHSHIGGSKKIIYTLDKLEGTNQFNTSEELEIEPGYYSLLFENCIPNIEVSLVSKSGMYNLDRKGSRHYSNWWTNIGFHIIYPLFLFLCVVARHCFDGDSTRILKESCNFRVCFNLKMMLILYNIVYTFTIDLAGFTIFPLALHRWLMNTLVNLSMMKMMLFLQSGCAVRTPSQLRVEEEVWGYVGCLAMIILSGWETYSSLEPCDAYRMGCFFGLNAIRCARSFAVIIMLYMVWKDNTDDATLKVTKSLTIPRSNLLFFVLLSHFGVMHLSFLLTMFPSTPAVAIALEELANLALFLSIYHLYLSPPSAHAADDDLEAPLINSQPCVF